MEEPTFVMPVPSVVGGVEIKDDLPRRPAQRFQKYTDKQPLEGAQPLRRASSLSTSVAMTGSRRSWSWSIRSS